MYSVNAVKRASMYDAIRYSMVHGEDTHWDTVPDALSASSHASCHTVYSQTYDTVTDSRTGPCGCLLAQRAVAVAAMCLTCPVVPVKGPAMPSTS